jgi:hypothetical protein
MKGMTPPQLWKAMQQNGQWPRGNCFVCGKRGHFAKQCAQRQRQQQQPRRSLPQTTANSVPPPPAFCLKCHRGQHWANQCHSRFTIDGQPINPTQENQLQGNYRGGPAARPLQTMAAMTFKPAQNPNGGFHTFKEPPQGVPDWTLVPLPESY